jgi:HD-GYP domain-containing protein (c-di-GMP phosphodiesterase class II)
MTLKKGTERDALTSPLELGEDLRRLSARLGAPVAIVRASSADDLSQLFESQLLESHLLESQCAANQAPGDLGPAVHRSAEACWQAATSLTFDGRAVSVAIDDRWSAALCGLNTEVYRAKVAALLEAPPMIARRLMEAAAEATRLARHAESMQVRLDASAVQIAQSFEEQCWLRDLARNLSISNETANANALARGILGPLLDLLRAEDLFVLVSDQETSRSGLSSSSFGFGRVAIEEMNALIESLRLQKPTGPIVVNRARFLDDRVKGLVAVPILSADRPLGYLVAINRLVHPASAAVPLCDPEFGSVEVGLLEEASVLLSTQTHNIRLVLDSQHLALGTLQAMSRAIDARDPYTRGHSERVARLSFEIAQIVGLEETACQEIYVTGILHDVGKIGVPDRVLLKPGALTDEEFDIIKQHPEIGYRIVEELGKLHFTLPGVLYHHERWDGLGYPHQLSGDNIPLMARIIAVADSFDAMTSCRPYRQAMPLEKACEIIASGAGKQWDAMLVRCFQQWHQRRTRALPELPSPGTSLIPQEPPYANITQSVLAMQM